ncbi:MAG: 4Fe-4S dicluster domain-containing protein [Deltaproteobacteria bacterium]|nr:MAG: 4Fe-4S dicluster domain-containing protein [Deltaproteobacteria bacterium]
MRGWAVSKAVLIDTTKCIGCRGCQVACKSWNDLKGYKTAFSETWTNPVFLGNNDFTRVIFREATKPDGSLHWYFAKRQCMHCSDPACASVCPVGAMVKMPEGPVVYDDSKCIGCRYCMLACPFGIPKFEWEAALPLVRKCTFCAERQALGLAPACVATCPTGTLLFGERDTLVQEAQRRIRGAPGKYVNHVYGQNEAGGTSWLYLAGVGFGELGFNTQVPKEPLPPLTWNYISHIPHVIAGVIAFGVGTWYVTRRQELRPRPPAAPRPRPRVEKEDQP